MNVAKEIAALRALTVKELQARYAEVFGEVATVRHRAWLIKRISWRLQMLAGGGLSARALARAAELANDADLRWLPPAWLSRAERATSATQPPAEGPTLQASQATAAAPEAPASDPRLPVPGTIITRVYKGRTVEVSVVAGGFAFEGTVYASLSAVAKAVTGSHCNGYFFFRLGKKGGPS